jgi:hypothetical protein
VIGFALRVGALLAVGVAGTYWLYVLAVRKRWVFAGIGAVLVAWGAWVYAPENAGAGWAWQEGWNEGSAAANKAVSAFFPSRGDYDAPIVPQGRCYWAFHTAAILYMLSLAVAVFGVELVNRGLVAWRRWLPFQWKPKPSLHRRELNVVWGLGEEGRRMAEGLAARQGKKSVVFAVEEGGGGWLDLKESGEALRALTREGWTWVLGRAGTPGGLSGARRHFFLGPDGYANAARAEALMRALRKRRRRGVVTVHVRTWTDADDDAVHAWADGWNRNLQGTDIQVEVVREEAVVSRKFLLDHPMLDAFGVGVDTQATAATGAFRVLVAGFGAQGRRLVAEMVADAQFLGPDGKPIPLEVDVADRDETSWGWFLTECAEACRRYNIRFRPLDVREAGFWTWLEEHPAYNRVVLATQDDAVNLEAAGRVANAYKVRFPEMRGQTGKIVFARVRNHALSAALRKATENYGLFGDTAETYTPQAMLHGRWNDGAVRVNGIWAAVYDPPPQEEAKHTAWVRKKWAGTSTLNKESSRASFFHQRNLLRLIGFEILDGTPTREELEKKGLVRVERERVEMRLREPARLAKLSEMEHMRWMAFHFVRGWHRWMPAREELEKLAEERAKEIAEKAAKKPESKAPTSGLRWMVSLFARGWRLWTAMLEKLVHRAEKRKTEGADKAKVTTDEKKPDGIEPNALKKAAPIHADLADYLELAGVDERFNAVNRERGWKPVDSAKKDRNFVFGLNALFGAGFTVAEKEQGKSEGMAQKGKMEGGKKGRSAQ